MKKTNLKPVSLAVGAAFAASIAAAPVANAVENPFSMNELSSGYKLASNHMEGNCGSNKGKEGNCGGNAKERANEGNCGSKQMGKGKEGNCGGNNAKPQKKANEGKCGEGKCGGSK
ncbi:MAG: hypothetical protein HUJ30_06315 [Gammaproteobacteria bacterium]|nr:hypothetical protein [Gammaproteobacteria bacterium]